MIEASPASIHCIATQFRPRYSAFWHSPRITTARHCARVNARQVWPISKAITTAMTPDRAKRKARANSGGTSVTIIRVEVKAEAHITAKNTPMRIARMSMPASFADDAEGLAGHGGGGKGRYRNPAIKDRVSRTHAFPRHFACIHRGPCRANEKGRARRHGPVICGVAGISC